MLSRKQKGQAAGESEDASAWGAGERSALPPGKTLQPTSLQSGPGKQIRTHLIGPLRAVSLAQEKERTQGSLFSER